MITHSRETYQPTSIRRWDMGIFNGSYGFDWKSCTCHIPMEYQWNIIVFEPLRRFNVGVSSIFSEKPIWSQISVNPQEKAWFCLGVFHIRGVNMDWSWFWIETDHCDITGMMAVVNFFRVGPRGLPKRQIPVPLHDQTCSTHGKIQWIMPLGFTWGSAFRL